jgi:hypothetical protein
VQFLHNHHSPQLVLTFLFFSFGRVDPHTILHFLHLALAIVSSSSVSSQMFFVFDTEPDRLSQYHLQ